MTVRARLVALCLSLLAFSICGSAKATDWWISTGSADPGKILLVKDGKELDYYTHRKPPHADMVSKVYTLSRDAEGKLLFASGLDRFLLEASRAKASLVKDGGYTLRRVRRGKDDEIFWSGLETPRDDQPLPDGFIYSMNRKTGTSKTVMTFSQGDVSKDWWGAFDVHDDKIYAATLNSPSKVYDITKISPTTLVATLPIRVLSIRFSKDGVLHACDGEGKLYRFPDLTAPEKFEVLYESKTKFTDFEFAE